MKKDNSCIPQYPPIVRKNALTMTPTEWKNFLLVLNEAKYTKSSYKIPIGYYNTNEGGATANLTFLDINVYDLFVWLHHYVSKDNVGPTALVQCDFAHEASGFLTWHRAALLVVERELQMTPTGQQLNYPIAIPYWDWTNHSPESINELFSNDRMGYSRNVTDTKEPQPIGGAFSNWTTVCYQEGFPEKPTLECLCDPRVSTGRLKRCLGCKNTLLHRSMDYLPLQSNIDKVKSLSLAYDIPPWDKIPNILSFRNSLEGYVNMSHIFEFGSGENGELHVQVHWWMGGNVAELSSSPNDPMFWLHHCMVDRIFEEWLRMKPRVFEPTTGAHPGHNRDDWLVGIYPLISNDDMFKNSTMLGYDYDTLNGQSNHTNSSSAVNPAYNS
jgi:tyrosinase